jgi:cytochrome c553
MFVVGDLSPYYSVTEIGDKSLNAELTILLNFFIFIFTDGGLMKLFNSRQIVFMIVAGLLAANAWATKSLSDVMEHRGLSDKYVLASANTDVPMGKQAIMEEPTNSKAGYDKLVAENVAKQKTIHELMGLVLSPNYYDFPSVTTLVYDALNQLNIAKDAENKAIAAAEKADWQNAIFRANKWQQYQDQATEMALRAKSLLEQHGAKLIVGVVTFEGETLYKRKACLTCHGVDAKTPIMPNYPSLAGQNQAYAVAQLKDIKSGARSNGVSLAMKSIMHTVNDAEMESIAEWLSSLSTDLTSDVNMMAEGAKLYQSKGCLACHGADATTPIMPIYPKIAGLFEEYAIAQMTDIKSGARHNGQSAAMKGVMLNVSDAEIAAIAQWLASLGESAEPTVKLK